MEEDTKLKRTRCDNDEIGSNSEETNREIDNKSEVCITRISRHVYFIYSLIFNIPYIFISCMDILKRIINNVFLSVSEIEEIVST